MAAPKNLKERQRIYDHALKLFAKQGYTKTKYSDIAEASGSSKSMVQHYFPKKELLVREFLNEHLESIAKEAEAYAGDDIMKLFCMMGLLHFHTLLNDETMSLFYGDLLASRELTDIIVEAERDWAGARLEGASEGPIFVKDALTVSLGGAYELMFQAVKSGKRLSASYVEYAAIVPFALSIGYERESIVAILEECISEFETKK